MSNHRHQQSSAQLFYRPDALSVAQCECILVAVRMQGMFQTAELYCVQIRKVLLRGYGD